MTMRELMLATAAAATLVSGSAGQAQPRPGGGQANGGPGAAPGGPPAAPGRPSGSFEASCRNIQAQGSTVTAECRNIHGRYPVSTITFTSCRGDLSNQNGVLSCQGAAASVPPGQDDGARDQRNNNGFAAGLAAGAVLGALGGNGAAPPPPQPAPPPPPPPGGDWRYGPEGWGYGHRPGEWVGIRDRAVWLDRRIDRASDAGYISRRETRDLRRDLAALQDLEYRYMRQGMAPWMRTDLDRRFDTLADRVPMPPPPRDYHRDRGYDGR